MKRLLILPLVAVAAACSSAPAPKPLPGGPPPEYEAPRAAGGTPGPLETWPGKPLHQGPPSPAVTGVNATTPAPGPPVPLPPP